MNNHTPPAEPMATNRSWVSKIPRIAFRTVLYLLALAYNAVTRSALYLVSGYLLTYFTLNADAGRAEVMDLLSSGLCVESYSVCNAIQAWEASLIVPGIKLQRHPDTCLEA